MNASGESVRGLAKSRVDSAVRSLANPASCAGYSLNTCDFLAQGRRMAQLPYIIMAVDVFLAGILCLLLPETNKAPTAETLDGSDSHALPALLADKNDDDEDQEKMTVM